ncbi:hypothetical protein AB987_0568 [Acinetobacter baumannii]|nr:hypothetical protein AB987_0568 [Acinetobacter baumannii]
MKFLNHLCDEERSHYIGRGVLVFLNHLCDEERDHDSVLGAG